MIKKTLYFGSPAKLSKQLEQLLVTFPAESHKDSRSLPIEDLGLIVLDHPQLSITHSLIVALQGNNTAILSCDASHLPLGLMLPLYSNKTFTAQLRFQLAASEPLKKQLWKQVVQAKIKNQSHMLAQLGEPTENYGHWAKSVRSGDPDNLEARAAAHYWQHLFEPGSGFGRRERFGSPPNSLLNYGYAVLRALVARALVGSGLLPALGIHHHNKYNPFCLADDLMEPYRPYVDGLVLQLLKEEPDFQELDKTHKAKLLSLPQLDVRLGSQTRPLFHAVQHSAASLAKCFAGERQKLLLPAL